MNIAHHVRKENSGLFRTTLEIANYEEKAGHAIILREPTGEAPIYISKNLNGNKPDVDVVHSQLPITSYHSGTPKFMLMHGEPLSSVGNKISMKAIVDLASVMDAFICMRKDEYAVWNTIKRTYLVNKGIDLEMYKPLPGVTERLSGEPAVVYYENWRGQRNPLYAVIAMLSVWKKYPNARLHLFNCNDKKMQETFKALIQEGKLWTYVRTLSGPVKDVNMLLNRCDMVVSCLHPLYARSIEAFGAGKLLICPGYKEHDYPFQCDLQLESMAEAIIKAWENRDQIDPRKWAEKYHNVEDTVNQCLEVYKRYV